MLFIYLITLVSADQELFIEDGYNSIKYEYCNNQQEGILITQEQFNNPSITKMISINETSLTQIIGKNTTQKLITQGYFYYTQTKKCAGFVYYDYHSEYQQQWQSLKQVMNQSKIDITKSGCQTTTFIYDYTKKAFNQLCKSYSKNSYSLNRSILGEGLHQNINTQIFIKEYIQGWIIVVDFLDIYTYVDKDELDKLSSQDIKYYLFTIIDIERPSDFSSQHLLVTKIRAKQQYNYQHQYHFRYQMAGDTHYKTSYAPADTLIYHINKDVDDIKKIMEIISQQSPIKQLNQHRVLQYEVPVGYQTYNGLVLLITLALTLGFSVHLAIQIILSDRKKLK